MTDDETVAAALRALLGESLHRDAAVDVVPRQPGLYALYGDDRAWADLRLSRPPERQPLYVGKAERSLNGRDVRTHFAAGKTGSSTVRRSLASLLDADLALVPVPRNLSRPDGSANFALDAASETRLTDWMARHLSLATWSAPTGTQLGEVETNIVRRLRPPLNLDEVGEPRERLRLARRQMAERARAWGSGGSRRA